MTTAATLQFGPPPSAGERSCAEDEPVLPPSVNQAEQKLETLARRLEDWQQYTWAHDELQEAVAEGRRQRTTLDGANAGTSSSTLATGYDSNQGTTNGNESVVVPQSAIRADRLSETLDSMHPRDFSEMPSVKDEDNVVGDNGCEGRGNSVRALPPVPPVINDVRKLLIRLEQIQATLAKAWEHEKVLVKQLRTDLKKFERERLRRIPVIVQKEHDHYFVNLSELEWQATYGGRQEIRMKHKLTAAEGQLSRLAEDFSFFHDYRTVMDQKMAEDKEAIEKLIAEQQQTARLQSEHNMLFAASESKLMIEREKVEMERQILHMKLDTARSALRAANDQLVMAEDSRDGTYRETIEWRETLTKANEKYVKLGEEILRKKTLEAVYDRELALKLADIREMLDELKLQTTRNEILQETRQKQAKREKAAGREAGRKLAKVQVQEHTALKRLKDATDEIDRMKEETAEAAKEITRCGKAYTRIKAKLADVQQQVSVTTEESRAMKKKKETVEARVHHTQRVFKGHEEDLKADLARSQGQEDMLSQEEIKLHLDIHRLNQEIDDTKNKMVEKKQTGSGLIKAVKKQEKELAVKVEKVKKEYSTTEVTRNVLQNQVEEVKTELKRTEEDLRGQIDVLEPEREKLEDEVATAEKQAEELKWQQEELERKIKGTEESIFGLGKLIKVTEKDIEEKTAAIQERQETLRQGRQVESRLEHELREVKEFRRQSADKHGQYMALEHGLLNKYKDELAADLKKNKELSEHYKKSQDTSMLAKSELADTLEQRGQLDASLQDHKQLVDWQRRMNDMLETIYKKRQYDSQLQLIQFMETTRENSSSLIAVEQGLSEAVQTVKAFLVEKTQ